MSINSDLAKIAVWTEHLRYAWSTVHPAALRHSVGKVVEYSQRKFDSRFSQSCLVLRNVTTARSGPVARGLPRPTARLHVISPRGRPVARDTTPFETCILIPVSKPAFQRSFRADHARITVCAPTPTTEQHGNPKSCPAHEKRTGPKEGKRLNRLTRGELQTLSLPASQLKMRNEFFDHKMQDLPLSSS